MVGARAPSVALLALTLIGLGACSGGDRAPPEVPGVDVARLTQEELNLYRRVLTEELSPCGGRTTLEQVLKLRTCRLAPLAARFVAWRVEENDSREEIAERYVARYSAAEPSPIDVEGAPILGEATAPVTIVVFSDFQCPHCARAATELRTTVEESVGRVRVVFHNFPLARRSVAMSAAIAGLAAHRQGRFWALHDLFYENRSRLNDEVIAGLAEEAGLDVDQFREDLLDPAVEAQVRAEQELGERLGVRGTPALFINDRRFEDPLARLSSALEEALVRVEMNRSSSATSDARVTTSATPTE